MPSFGLDATQSSNLAPVLKKNEQAINKLRSDPNLSRAERAAKLREMRQAKDAARAQQLPPDKTQAWRHLRTNPFALNTEPPRFAGTNRGPDSVNRGAQLRTGTLATNSIAPPKRLYPSTTNQAEIQAFLLRTNSSTREANR